MVESPQRSSGQSALRDPKSAIGQRSAGGFSRPSRDTVTTIRADGSRAFLYPADVRGRFTSGRQVAAAVLIAEYLLLPWIPVDGFPAVFLDVAHRRFHFFGYTLAAQDAWLLFFAVSGLGFFLFFLTALFGRLWCGWACPQTVFLDHVYRRIERWIEGDATRRRQLAAAPWSGAKAARLTLKHALYAIVSLGIAHLFLAYFVSIPALWSMMRTAPGEHWSAFLFVAAFAGLLHFNFVWFREQMCIVLCPYGRLQSALTDEHSLVIGYDTARGEPRGKLNRGYRGQGRGASADDLALTSGLSPVPSPLAPDSSLLSPAALGACVDCHRCVQVCPTGIDIRHGLQMECIGCAACIDACDEVMTRVQLPRGLIRYDSLAGFGGGRTRWVRARTLLYGLLLFAGASVATYAFSGVRPASMSVVRMTGSAYFVDATSVRNQMLVRILNKRATAETFVVTVEGLSETAVAAGFEAPVTVASMAETVAPLVVRVDRRSYSGPFTFVVRVRDQAGTYQLEREVRFLGPDAALLREEDHEKGVSR